MIVIAGAGAMPVTRMVYPAHTFGAMVTVANVTPVLLFSVSTTPDRLQTLAW